jgi:uncharacterized protein YwqG
MCLRWIARHARREGSPGSTQHVDELRAEMASNPKPLDFIALLSLREFDAESVGLPGSGYLSFFYDVERARGAFWPEAAGSWRVFYIPDGELVAEERDDTQMFRRTSLCFEPQYTLPADIRAETGDSDLHIHGSDEYELLHQALLGADDRMRHQISGPPVEVQHGLFQQCQLASHGVDCGTPSDLLDPRVPELLPGIKDWRLLFQIDCDQLGPGFMWGDSGRLYFCVQEQHLRGLDLSKSWVRSAVLLTIERLLVPVGREYTRPGGVMVFLAWFVVAQVACRKECDPLLDFCPLQCIDEDGDGIPILPRVGPEFEVQCPAPDRDCDDYDVERFPGNPEVAYDRIDQDCDRFDLVDVDGDGFPGIARADWETQTRATGDLAEWPDGVPDGSSEPPRDSTLDCDDEVSAVHPGAPEIGRDGIDSDCDLDDG